MNKEALIVNKVNQVYGYVVNLFAAVAMGSVALMSISISLDVLKR